MDNKQNLPPTTLPPFLLLLCLHRSGSTWASAAIIKATRGRMIREPFQWKRYPEREKFHVRYSMDGIEEQELLDILWKSTKPGLNWVDRILGRGPILVKDVHILLSVETVWENLRPGTIILIRHPCNLATSWSKLKYEVRFRIDKMLSQDKLMDEHLAPFERHLRRQGDNFFEIGVYWGAIHYVMSRLSEKHPEWQWITHEALCEDPFTGYINLLNNLYINVDDRGRRSLNRFLHQHNRVKKENESPFSTFRLIATEPEKWKRKLSDAQSQSVLEGAIPFGIIDKFYPVQPNEL